MMAICAAVTGYRGGLPANRENRIIQSIFQGRPQITGRSSTPSAHCEPFAHGNDRRMGKIAKLINLQSRLEPLR
jgi:hypothetical protein